MEILIVLGVIAMLLAIAWFIVKVVIAYLITCVVLLGVLTIKEKLDL